MVSTLYRTNAVICGSSGGRNIAPDQAEQEKEKAYKYPVGSLHICKKANKIGTHLLDNLYF